MSKATTDVWGCKISNTHNLTPFDTMDPERQREIARLGGIASGVARRRKRDLHKQTAEFLFAWRVVDKLFPKRITKKALLNSL